MLRTLTERVVEKQRNLYVCFIDCEKAFDNVRHVDLLEILKSIGVTGKEYRLIRNLYWGQKATMIVNGEETSSQNIKRGVNRDVFYPQICFLYMEK